MRRPPLTALSRNMHRSLKARQIEEGFEAVARHDVNALRTLLEEGLSPDAVHPAPEDLAMARELAGERRFRYRTELALSSVQNRMPLLLAAAQALRAPRSGNLAPVEVFRLLLEKGANGRGTDAAGNTVLHVLASSREAGMALTWALQAGAVARARNRAGASPFHALACSSGFKDALCGDVIDPWLSLGLDPNAPDKRGRTPLDAAVSVAAPCAASLVALVAAGCRWTTLALSRARRLCARKEGAWQSLQSSLEAFDLEQMLVTPIPVSSTIPGAPTPRPRL